MMLDFDQIVIKAVRSELDSETRKRYDSKHPIIDYNFMAIRYGDTTYNKTKKPSIPTFKVVYRAIYSNQTPSPQTYALSTTRSTTSVKEYTYEKAFTFDGKMDTPIPIKGGDVFLEVGVNVSKTKCKANTITHTHQMTWSVDSNLVVPPKSFMTAELVVKEEEFNGDFSTSASFEGDIICYCPRKDPSRFRVKDYYSKKDKTKELLEKEYYEMVRLRVENIFTEDFGFTIDRFNRPAFLTTGVVYSKYGVEQEVCLTQYSAKPPPFELSDSK